MSRERARARAARLAARAAEVSAAAATRSRRERRAARLARLTGRLRSHRPNRRRDVRVLLGAVASYGLLQLVIWQLLDDAETRFGLGLLTLALFPIATHLLTDPRSRR